MTSEPSKKFFKIFIAIFVINVALSTFIYLVSPEQIPSTITQYGFENYRNKTVAFFPVLGQLMALFIALISYKLYPVILLNFYPAFYRRFIKFVNVKFFGFPENIDFTILVLKVISTITLALSVGLILFNFGTLGFAFEIANLNNYLAPYLAITIATTVLASKLFAEELQ